MGIAIEYAQVLSQAAAVEKCAQTLESVKRQLDTLTAEIGQNWKGEAATDFLAKCEALSEKIETASAEVSTTASAIIKTAKLYRDAEEQATQTAHAGSGFGGGGGGGGSW